MSLMHWGLSMMTVHYVYILICRGRRNRRLFYTGMTTDPVRRFREHAEGRGARFTKAHAPITLGYLETVRTLGGAMRREREIKKMGPDGKRRLVNELPIIPEAFEKVFDEMRKNGRRIEG